MTESELAQLATLYHVDGCTQDDLSRQFGISRATVGRLLRRAREEGIVEIRVRPHAIFAADLERQLTERFRIQRALIAVDHKDSDKQRELLAGLVASELDRILLDGSVVAVGMGRNLSCVSEHAMSTTRRECNFVSAIGGSYRGGEAMNADHIARRLAARFGGKSESLYAPALVGDPQVRRALLENDTVRHTLDKARRADVALIGVGDVSVDSNMVRMGWFSAQEISEARRAGTVGDMMGYDFIDIHGRPAPTPMQGRVIGLTRDDLQRIPNVIAVAAETSKVTAILGALRTGTIDTLATTAGNAAAVLQLEAAMNSAR
ncbi:sugar-binding transcriptional regulator [Verminephrobacter aporrectodeae subsp. tuberculatae]|uniref:Sugar-binding transcriptional regulator n=1 Tax=Verminephrobacter aporrectodeae subsp. tuberculatae TaxID=1110392 RepID=A0ABT3KWS5_9BURK|nr:sugar-binding transcriptional regulator [Verminephrobacter aporrectodeae]MCW5221771.1 sugar-binding transcriptional regulator [Verminephrobacter aporrectodeae subsp. tuberculatae]MCW5258081.1 sugar-binding transcriptional regulator [Verminephrobacter aporrectodeae subsp. tuberculatae]MCW5291061.1 sugar-binding transcriptional regulator [Verminephrobacter aporrectodeae subsp. tuberculatae]MCW5322778.1 sugar-binding transcriptional regulator [Verminephrobacter aporrectodeae subsp. tuberculatae